MCMGSSACRYEGTAGTSVTPCFGFGLDLLVPQKLNQNMETSKWALCWQWPVNADRTFCCGYRVPVPGAFPPLVSLQLSTKAPVPKSQLLKLKSGIHSDGGSVVRCWCLRPSHWKTGIACLAQSLTVLGLNLQQHWQLEVEICMVNTRQDFLVRRLLLLKPPQNLVLLKCMAEVEEHQRQVKALFALVFVCFW